MTAVVLPALKRAAQVATARATDDAKQATRQAIARAGLGKLGGAVGSTTSLRQAKLRGPRGEALGIIFARGTTGSRANQTLLAYSEGASIFPTGGKKWLAFPTDKIPKRVGREKMTPALYRSSGLVSSIGKLRFVADPNNANQALLIARKVTVSRRTGRAKAYAGRTPRGSDRADSVVAFVLIKWTRRQQRFDMRQIMSAANNRIGGYVGEELSRIGPA